MIDELEIEIYIWKYNKFILGVKKVLKSLLQKKS